MTHAPYNFTQEQLDCEAERKWPYFIYSILASFLAFLLFALLQWLLCIKCCRGKDSDDNDIKGSTPFSEELKDWAESTVSGQSRAGKFLVVFIFVCNVVAVVVYMIDTNRELLEECIRWDQLITLQIDFGLGIIFLLYFLLRMIAADSFFKFLFSNDTIIDIITLPPLFLSVFLERTWIGVRFWRFFYMVNLPDVLVYIRVLNNSTSIRLTQLIAQIIGFFFWSAGFIYLLENQGDFFHDYENAVDKGGFRFVDSLWYLMITASTVGYGDFFPVTDFGKCFAILFISIGVGGFATLLPELATLLSQGSKYGGKYSPPADKQFLIVCGNITYASVSNFIYDFYHPAREDVNAEIVFLNKNEPDLEFEGLLKQEKTRGTMLSTNDLQRVSAEKAAAVLVLCDKFSQEPAKEDLSNIMRVISLKNYSESTRCIIQLLYYSSKAYLLNIPGWDWRRDDQAVCLNEIKYGMLAQSCLAPGFFTLASNMITASNTIISQEMPKWKQEYLSTASKVILAETLSPTFVGLTFQEAAEICYTKLNLVLMAVEDRKYEGGNIWINPRNRKIAPNVIGLFLTKSSDAAKRAWFYCRVCHENLEHIEDLKRCSCKKLAKARFDYFNDGQNSNLNQKPSNSFQNFQKQNKALENGLRKRRGSKSSKEDENRQETAKMKYDSSGSFHWTPSKQLSDVLITRQEANVTMFAGHVVIAVFAEDTSNPLGLRTLVMPLRASNIAYNDLRHVIIVANLNFMRKEWGLLSNLPKISVMEGSPTNRADLRSVKVNLARTVILLSAMPPDRTEPVLADKEIIMSALNIKSMSFDGGDIIQISEDTPIMGEEDPEPNSVNMLLDVSFATNVRYLDEQEIYLNDNIELSKTLPFACGMAMARGVLDSLMSATYFNASLLKLLRFLVTGGANIDLEKSLAEGAGLRGGYSTDELEESKNRVRVEEIVLRDSMWSRYAENGTRFADLYVAALRENGTLCIGITRMIAEDNENDEDLTRVVISAPDNIMTLQPMDNIIALVQYDDDKEKVD